MGLVTYWVPIVVTGVAAIAAGWLPRRHPRWPWRAIGVCLALVLAICEGTWWVKLLGTRPFSPATDLPLQLCDLTAWVAAAAMVLRRETLYDLTWFWGVGGGIPALFLPVRGAPFPNWFYFEFYLMHGALIVAGLLAVAAFQVRIRRRTLLRSLLITGAVTVGLGIVDAATGSNYMYLSTLPPVTGPLQVLSNWPFYRIALCSVAAIVMVCLGWIARDRAHDVETVTAPTGTSG